MGKNKRIEKEITPNGFIQVKKGTWINERGECINGKNGKIKHPKNIEISKKGRILTAKVVLWLFKGEEPRTGQIRHKNGNKQDNSVNNVEYITKKEWIKPERVNKENLKTAIRCFFSLERKRKISIADHYTKMQIEIIYKERILKMAKNEIFEEWVIKKHPCTEIAKKYNERVIVINSIIASYLNNMINAICDELKEGKQNIYPYLETKRERRIRETKRIHEHGMKRKPPIRFPTNIKKSFNEIGLEIPKCPKWEKHKKLTNNTKIITWLIQAKQFLEIEKKREKNEQRKEDIKEIENQLSQNIFQLVLNEPETTCYY